MVFYIFIICLCIGSFLNVIIYRLPRYEEFIMKRSYCPNCNHVLGCFDLIPLLSYAFLGGKCRYCQSKISIQYPLIEFIMGCLGIYCFNQFGFNLMMCFHFILFCILMVISIIDMKTMLIPDSCNFSIVVLALFRIFLFDLNLYELIFYACIIALFIWIVNRIQLSFGGGDMKLLFSLGLYFGNQVIFVFVLSVFIGALYGVYLLISKKANRKTFFPFGPFLSFSCFICVFYGKDLIQWYLNWS